MAAHALRSLPSSELADQYQTVGNRQATGGRLQRAARLLSVDWHSSALSRRSLLSRLLLYCEPYAN